MSKEKKRILLLTNFNNGTREDFILSKYLKKYFNVVVSDLNNCKKYESNADLILIRNLWPIEELGQSSIIRSVLRWKIRGIKTYSYISFKKPKIRKTYLISLLEKGYPVIPTIKNKSHLEKLGSAQKFLIKPVFGCDGRGQKILSEEGLRAFKKRGYVIQPFIKFKKEIGFYFIDGQFQYAVSCRHKLKYDSKIYRPANKEIDWATRFVEWNNLLYGIQRVDACLDLNGNLLLTEIEDTSFYLNFNLLSEKERKIFIKNLARSILNAIGS